MGASKNPSPIVRISAIFENCVRSSWAILFVKFTSLLQILSMIIGHSQLNSPYLELALLKALVERGDWAG